VAINPLSYEFPVMLAKRDSFETERAFRAYQDLSREIRKMQQVTAGRINQILGDQSWTSVSFSNSWVDYGSSYNACEFRKVGDFVYLRGLMKDGTVTAGAFTLPVNYRPPAHLIFSSVTNTGLGRLDVFSTGAVVLQSGGNSYASVNCLIPVT